MNKARARGADIEGEFERIGRAAVGHGTMDDDSAHDRAMGFIRRTGVTCFSPDVGTLHGDYTEPSTIHTRRIVRLASASGVPQVLHGASGIPPKTLREVLELRVSKVNFWTVQQYAATLRISGGLERLNSLRSDPTFRSVFPLSATHDEWLRTIRAWHRRKTEIYIELIHRGRLTVRPGVRRLATEAAAGGRQLAVASAGAEESVRAVLVSVMGRVLSSRFTVIPGNGTAKKPAPDIYTCAVTELGRHPKECVVVEDNRNGLLAAEGAGIPCLVTPTAVSRDHFFDEAELVMSSLGDPGGEQARR
ncbi:HAD-IA family hydrolase [Streptomyces hirsutus]|uniref:HAD-IA family hydrolase n=1 Tax=Streptomyces hirsutus TaxID=35620 RepID=A0ABZ1GY71_9ACTN|nr:HAD-IA family hydrolase [Streptomyces hirsutus]WSD10989.1 HAD-IA family hydrolase [Streptomyces hirsutus]WTD15668.1 HAD-IA family hydrolase [Streptomyces hirsutus]